jgi:rod shape-determining protein MreD
MTMSEYPDALLDGRRRRHKEPRLRPLVLVLAPLAAILFQVYVPLFVSFLAHLELPLLVTVYFAVMRRRPISGTLYGAAIGLVQDALSHHPLGLFGIVKTTVGYLAASLSIRFDVENPLMRSVLAFAFFVFHQFCYWAVNATLLGSEAEFHPGNTLLFGLMNGALAIPVFQTLDKLRGRA